MKNRNLLKDNFIKSHFLGLSALYTFMVLFCNQTVGQSTNQNYVRSAVPRTAIPSLQTLETNIFNANIVETSYAYFDQQGRNIQTVGFHQSPSGNDVVQLDEYDPMGRQSKKWLPYTFNGNNSGAFRVNGTSEALGFYSSTVNIPQTGIPYANTAFDISTLNRPLEQSFPGETWQIGSGHTVKSSYGVNVAGEIHLWTINNGGNGASYSNYAAGALTTLSITDENGNVAIQYKDHEGKLISKKIQSGSSTYLTTDYVYDDAGNLQYIIPPLPSVPSQVALPTSFIESDAVFLNFFYANHYDGRNRLIEKKVPGKGWEFNVYNKADQVILNQNPSQAALGLWLYYKYDANGRVVQTGELTSASSRSTLQNAAGNFTGSLWDAFNNSSTNFGYTDNSYPDNSLLGSKKVVLSNYYDNYNFTLNSALNPNSAVFVNPSLDTLYKVPSGLLTGSISNVIGTSYYLFNVVHYDYKGNPVKTITQTFKSGTSNANQYDIVENLYSFNSLLVKTNKSHYLPSGLQVAIVSNLRYDLQGRKVLLQQQYSTPSYTSPLVNLAKFEYNETGQLIKKSLHVIDNGTASVSNITLGAADALTGSQQRTIVASGSIVLSDGFHADAGTIFSASIVNGYQQVINYAYNTRGWMTKINDPNNFDGTSIFAEKIDYDQPNTGYVGYQAQYNGNISTVSTQTLVKPGLGITQEIKGYIYQYDPLNRLKSGTSQAPSGNNKNSETLTYDELGNVLTLNRTLGSGYQNVLAYDYGSGVTRGNQLFNIQDNGGSENYSGGYTYLISGNVQSDAPSGVNQISYNELNLPSQVNLSQGKTITYYYDASGNKLEKVIANTSGTLEDRSYINGIEYTGNSISFIATPEGRVIPSGNNFAFEYSITDHLGNVRAVFGDKNNDNTFNASTDIVQETDYYPFGRQIALLDANPQYQYKFNGKEYSQDLNAYDYGARLYNPIIARWSAVDNAAESSRRWSTYSYAYNNPVRNIDPDGNFSYDYSTAVANAQASSLSQINYNGLNNAMQDSFDYSALAEYNAGQTSYLPDRYNPISNALRASMFSQIDEQYSAYTKGKGPSDGYGSLFYSLNGSSGGNGGGLGNFLLHLTPFGGVVDFTNAARNGDVGGAILGLASTAAFFTGEGAIFSSGNNTTTLYRAVSSDEIADISSHGIRNIESGYTTSKLFATSLQDAANYGRMFYNFENKPFSIIQTSINNSYRPMLYNGEMDLMNAISVPTNLFNNLSTPYVYPYVPLPNHPWIK